MGTISHDGDVRELARGKTVFDYADELAVRVATSCGRAGTCHECVVQIDAGMAALCPRTDAERFLHDPFRLACQAEVVDPASDVHFAPLRRQPRVLTAGVSASPETDGTPRLDPAVTRRGDGVYLGEERIDRYHGRMLGLAVDVGTTTVAMELVDLESGSTLRVSSFGNPQLFAGSDIMNRVSYDDGEFRGELQAAIVSGINSAILDLGRELGTKRRRIYEVTIAGNSTMRDLVFGVDVQSLGQKPYKSQIEHQFRSGERVTTALSSLPRTLGLIIHPQARVYGLPLIASHVGADTAACLLAIGMADLDSPVMLVDVGTNTEVVVGHRDRLIATSCPAGPAFEGGLITYGMPAYDGAIESLVWEGGRFAFRTIGDARPEGICGSGLIDLVAELRRHEMITPKGVFTADRRLKEIDVVPGSITFSRADASALAQAKAANYCGQVIAMRHFGIDPAELTRLYLAGGFATYVDARNAIEIGMLAPVPAERIEKVGNAAVEGARIALLSAAERQRIDALAQRIEHVELEMEPDFFELFVDGCRFEPMQLGATAR
jgi:uncharacterized 2Fe-2S/4Fe-4S cluster protein (DUF4445 family)